ncbi:MAG: DUF3313 family protein, partial [Bradyrhizobium sp.]
MDRALTFKPLNLIIYLRKDDMKDTLMAYLAIMAIGPALTGCASTRPIPYSELASSPQLQPNVDDRSGRVPYDYSSGISWHRYASIVVDPVTIYRGPDHQFDDIPEADRQELADYMHAEFSRTLREHFKIVGYPDERT